MTVTRGSTNSGRQLLTLAVTTPEPTAARTVHNSSVARNSDEVVDRGLLPLPGVATKTGSSSFDGVTRPSSGVQCDDKGGGSDGGIAVLRTAEELDGLSTCWE